MKTYLPQIERRILVRPNQSYGILNYDADNAYPQRMLEMVGSSPTAKDCWNKRARFTYGNGWEDELLRKLVVNETGLTLAKLLKAVATDRALFCGFGIHINWNAGFRITDAHYVRFEDIRQGDTDNADTRGKFALYSDWGRRTWKNITRSKITFLDPYSPDPEVITRQVVEAGGWDEYKGQLYYFNPEVDDYPLIEADSVWEDFETEAGIKIFNNREVTTGFLPAAMLFMQSRREEADNTGPEPGDEPYVNTTSGFERDLGAFQGVKNGQKIVVVEYDYAQSKPELQPYPIQNNDKLFEATVQSVEARIIKGFSVPKELVSQEKGQSLNNSGGDKKEAIREFNDNTAPDRLELSEIFREIFSHWHEPVTANNWNIIQVPGEVADDAAGIKAGQSINQLLMSTLPAANKISILQFAYGFNESDATAMVPPDRQVPGVEKTTQPQEETA